MKIYHYHEESKQFLREGRADPCQLKKDDWLVPAFATTQAPPVAGAGKAAFFIGGSWVLRAVHTPDKEISTPGGQS